MIDQAQSLLDPTRTTLLAQCTGLTRREEVLQPAVLVSQAPVHLNYKRYLNLKARCLSSKVAQALKMTRMSSAFKGRDRLTRSDRSPPESQAFSLRAPVLNRVAAAPLISIEI